MSLSPCSRIRCIVMQRGEGTGGGHEKSVTPNNSTVAVISFFIHLAVVCDCCRHRAVSLHSSCVCAACMHLFGVGRCLTAAVGIVVPNLHSCSGFIFMLGVGYDRCTCHEHLDCCVRCGFCCWWRLKYSSGHSMSLLKTVYDAAHKLPTPSFLSSPLPR